MKKLVATAAAAALLGTAAFADIKLGGWGRGVWLTGNAADGEDNTVKTCATKSWGDTGPRVGVNLSGESENIGFFTEFHAEEQKFSDYRIWWSPVEQIKVFLGTNPNHFRGDACYGMWDIFRCGVVDIDWNYNSGSGHYIDYKEDGKAKSGSGTVQQQEEGWTFMSHSSNGAQILVTPIEGLKLVAAFDFPLTNGYGGGGDELAEVVGRQSKYAAAYDIEGVGTVKLGVTEYGKVSVKDGKKDQNVISAAFDLKAIENLTLSVGTFIPLVQKTVVSGIGNKEEIGWGNQVNAFAKYKADALTISGRVGTIIGTYDQKAKAGETSGIESTSGAFGFLVGAGVEYAIPSVEGLSVIGEVDYANGIYTRRSSADKNDCLDFGIAVSKSYSNGKFVAGFEGATNFKQPFSTAKSDDFGWCVPLCFEYWF